MREWLFSFYNARDEGEAYYYVYKICINFDNTWKKINFVKFEI